MESGPETADRPKSFDRQRPCGFRSITLGYHRNLNKRPPPPQRLHSRTDKDGRAMKHSLTKGGRNSIAP
jgi:hypothetical protein